MKLLILVIASALSLAAQSIIFVSRHADRYGTEPDPTITPAGEKQAEALGRMLAVAHVKHIS